MRKIYSIVVMMFALAAVWSCEGNGFLVSREKLDASEAENRKLSAAADSIRREYARQADELADILAQIAELSNRTARITVDGSEKPLSQVEMARGDIKAIRERIDGLEKEVEVSRKNKSEVSVSAKTIRELRATLDLKEKEILRLREQIIEKDRTIRQQDETISVQKDTISRQMKELQAQKKELQRQVEAQIELLYRAGNRFREIADEGDFKVTGRRNKMNVKQYRLSIYQEALDLYEAAAAQGHKAAKDSLSTTRRKVNELIASKK